MEPDAPFVTVTTGEGGRWLWEELEEEGCGKQQRDALILGQEGLWRLPEGRQAFPKTKKNKLQRKISLATQP